MTIAHATIRDFFRDLRARGVSTDRPLLWGYFFVDPDEATLRAIQPRLVEAGYRFVDLYPSAGDDEDYFLHVERVEVHDAGSLFARCNELAALAEQHGVAAFDGFDVGNVDGSALYR